MSYPVPAQPQIPAAMILDAEVGKYAATGWTLVHRSEYTAVVAMPGGAVNHVLHLILTLVSCGLWAPVWLLLALTNPSPKRLSLTVHSDGSVSVSRP